jgi:hypothetical protein
MPDDFARQGRYLTGHYNDFHYRTPLHLAAATGNDEITKFLLVNKAKTNLCDNDGRTALMKVRPLVYTDRHMILKWRRSLDVQGLKKYLWFRFPTNPIFFLPTLLFFHCNWPCDPIFSGWLQAAYTACQNGVCCHTNYWTKLPKFVHRKYAFLVNIDVGTLLKIAQQKTAKTMKKIFKKNLFPTYWP